LPKQEKDTQPAEATGATVGNEARFCEMTGAWRGLMDTAEHKEIVVA
jgi:hypothetical protein